MKKLVKKSDLISYILAISVCLSGLEYVLTDAYEMTTQVARSILPLSVTGLLISLHFNIEREKSRDRNMIIGFLVAAISFLSLTQFLYSNTTLTTFNWLYTYGLIGVLVFTIKGEDIRNYTIPRYLKVLKVPFVAMGYGLKKLKATIPQLSSDKVDEIVKGVWITIPILIILTVLFSSADAIYAQRVSDLFDLDIEFGSFYSVVRFSLMTLLYFGTLLYGIKWTGTTEKGQNQAGTNTLSALQNKIILAPINLLFFSFVLLQFNYLFGGIDNIGIDGMTYAEYARRGFFELIIIGFFIFGVLRTISLYQDGKNIQAMGAYKILSIALIAQTFVILYSSFVRMNLYIDTYGYTWLRLLVQFARVFLVVTFTLLTHHIYTNLKSKYLDFYIFMLITTLVVLLNLINPEGLIVRQNIKRYEKTGKIDINYLMLNLSKDAADEVLEFEKQVDDEQVQRRIDENLWYYEDIGVLEY